MLYVYIIYENVIGIYRRWTNIFNNHDVFNIMMMMSFAYTYKVTDEINWESSINVIWTNAEGFLLYLMYDIIIDEAVVVIFLKFMLRFLYNFTYTYHT